MRTIPLKPVPVQYAHNKGNHAEQAFEFAVTGKISPANNRPHTAGGDVLQYQVKSPKASVCRGTNLDAYLDEDGAQEYAFVNKDVTIAYIMDRAEWTAFVKTFGYKTRESTKNGGGEKIRLLDESKRMVQYLQERV